MLSLIVHELDEAVRMGCLDFMRSIASNVDVQSEMGSMGAIPIMLSFIADAEVHPLNIRQSAVSILSQLCHDHPDNKVARTRCLVSHAYVRDVVIRSCSTVLTASLS